MRMNHRHAPLATTPLPPAVRTSLAAKPAPRRPAKPLQTPAARTRRLANVPL